MGDPLKTAAQLALLAGNGASFGLMSGGEETARNLAAARRDLGFGAAAAEVAGGLAGGGGALALGWKGLKGARALWSGRAAAAPALRAIAAHPIAASSAAALPVGATIRYASDAYDPQAAASPADIAALRQRAQAQPAPAQGRHYPDNPLAAEAYARAGVRGAQGTDELKDMGAPGVGEMMAATAARQGGMLSNEQMAAITDYARGTAVAPVKQPGYRDVLTSDYRQAIDNVFMQKQATAKALLARGDKAGAQKMFEDAYGERLTRLGAALGVKDDGIPDELDDQGN